MALYTRTSTKPTADAERRKSGKYCAVAGHQQDEKNKRRKEKRCNEERQGMRDMKNTWDTQKSMKPTAQLKIGQKKDEIKKE